jgi:predicted transcriptional regulator
MHHAPLVNDIMVESKFSVKPSTAVYEALDLLIAKKLSGLPVVDEKVLVGFLTEKDCLRLQATAHMYNMTGRLVRDIMSSINEALKPDADLLSAALVFLQCNFTVLPVIEDGVLLGSLTRQKVILGIQKWHHDRGLDFQHEKESQHIQDNPTSIESMQKMVSQSQNKEQLASVFRMRR